jgi:multidrug efflux system membrane fusion protein
MTRRNSILLATAVIAVGAIVVAMRWFGPSTGAVAQGPPSAQARTVAVETAPAARKKTPLIVEGLGTVTPMASVAVRSRIDNEIVGIHFSDGALVKKGDLLVTLDTRAIEAQIKQAEGQLARDQAQLDGAERDVRRYSELVPRGATPQTNLDNAKTQADTFRAAIKTDMAVLENLKVQLSYCTIRAPIDGRISQAAVKVGNVVRTADPTPIATIIQVAPVYVTFSTPQRNLPDIRRALAAESATVEAIIPGEPRRANGQVAMIENTVDAATGMAIIRASMPNEDELLWPGTLVTARLTLRVEEAVTVPSVAVQVSQTGTFVYVVKNATAVVQPVTVARTYGNESVIEHGLDGGETVVTDGHLLLANGTRVTVRERRAGV